MKKLLCLILSIILLFSISSCTFERNIKRISVEQTEAHFNQCVENVKECIKENGFDDVNFDYEFIDNSGSMFFYTDDYFLSVELYNNRENPFGKNYESGIEQFYIDYNRNFHDEKDVLNTENPSYKIIATALSYFIGEVVTEEELRVFFAQLKESVDIPDFDRSKNHTDLFHIDTKFKEQTVEYWIDYYSRSNGTFMENIIFGAHQTGYTNQGTEDV